MVAKPKSLWAALPSPCRCFRNHEPPVKKLSVFVILAFYVVMTLHTLTTYKLIGSIISFKQPKEALVAQLQDFIHWKQLVYHSSKHLLLPTLYKRLEEQQLLYLLPEDLKDYLKQIYSINFNRNQLLLKQVTTLHQIFTQANIQHVFLKVQPCLSKAPKLNGWSEWWAILIF